jgi:deazaflavin-dependent oxidoreductase (nitroreductase family)
VRADPRVTVEAEGRTFEAIATITSGAQHDRLWQAHVAALPGFADYPAKAGRAIPIVRLTSAASA